MEQIIIIGCGGHAKSVIDTIERSKLYTIVGVVVDKGMDCCPYRGYPVIGNDEDLQRLYDTGIHNAFICIGNLGGKSVRKKLSERLTEIGYRQPVIVDPSAIVADDVLIDTGTYVGKRAVINSNARVGKNVIINTAAIVEHDCIIEDFTHLAVGSIVCGGVTVGSNGFIGANATVIQSIKIGVNVIVGAGAVVKSNLPDSCTAVGVPAKIIK